MYSSFRKVREAIREQENEVDEIAADLIRQGVEPYVAIIQARRILKEERFMEQFGRGWYENSPYQY